MSGKYRHQINRTIVLVGSYSEDNTGFDVETGWAAGSGGQVTQQNAGSPCGGCSIGACLSENNTHL